jgi:hypothetical protein
VTWIKLYLGDVDPGNLRKTCVFSPAESPAACSVGVGLLSRGSYTLNVVASDGTQTTTESGTFNVAGYTTANQMTVTRNAAGATEVDFDLSFTLGGSSTGTLEVTFPLGFEVTREFQSGSCSLGGSITDFDLNEPNDRTLTATKTDCEGQVTVTGAQITLPSTPGEYIITWTNDNGTAIIAVVDSDQVSVSGTVDPSRQRLPPATAASPAQGAPSASAPSPPRRSRALTPQASRISVPSSPTTAREAPRSR